MNYDFITLVVGGLVVALLLFASKSVVTSGLGQYRSDRKRRRAHAGKVQCEIDDCTWTATRLTPNGYFCAMHWLENEKKPVGENGYVAWNHILYHALKGHHH